MSGQATSLPGEATLLSGEPTSLSGEPTSLSGEPTSVSGEPTSVSGEPTSVSGEPTSVSGEAISMSSAMTIGAGCAAISVRCATVAFRETLIAISGVAVSRGIGAHRASPRSGQQVVAPGFQPGERADQYSSPRSRRQICRPRTRAEEGSAADPRLEAGGYYLLPATRAHKRHEPPLRGSSWSAVAAALQAFSRPGEYVLIKNACVARPRTLAPGFQPGELSVR
jgi:hypothetical protein